MSRGTSASATRRIAVTAGASNITSPGRFKLVELGLVNARRSRVGGLELTDAGRHVSIGWLVRELGATVRVIDCESPDSPCPLVPACRLRRALAEGQEAFANSTSTLMDLAGAEGSRPFCQSQLKESVMTVVDTVELEPAHAEIVRAITAPIGAHIDEITTAFYRRMFRNHPELPCNLFNRGNQAQVPNNALWPPPSRRSPPTSSIPNPRTRLR